MTAHTAIPTTYRGYKMRSRLEAKWACVFDQLGWTWEYEPFDLKGWIPDFLITNAVDPFLVEVKPLNIRDEKLENEISAALGHTFIGKTVELGNNDYEYDALIVGAHPFFNDQDEFCIGWLSDSWFGDWYAAPILDPDSANTPFGLSSGILGMWRDRMNGTGHKDTLDRRCDESVLREHWAVASNKTQWRAPR